MSSNFDKGTYMLIMPADEPWDVRETLTQASHSSKGGLSLENGQAH